MITYQMLRKAHVALFVIQELKEWIGILITTLKHLRNVRIAHFRKFIDESLNVLIHDQLVEAIAGIVKYLKVNLGVPETGLELCQLFQVVKHLLNIELGCP